MSYIDTSGLQRYHNGIKDKLNNNIKSVSQTLTSEEQAQARNNISAYTKPTAGIPKTDLTTAVQTSLGKADSALQAHQPAVKYDTATQGLTDTQKANALANIGITVATDAEIDAILNS